MLCPGFVKTRIHESGRARQDKYGGKGEIMDNARSAETAQAVLTGIDPNIVGERVVESVRDGDLYIFTHPQFRDVVKMRYAGIEAAFDKAANSNALKAVKEWAPIMPANLQNT